MSPTTITCPGAYHLSRRATLEQWRRNDERPIVARMLTLSADAVAEWQWSAVARNEWMNALEVDPAGAHENPRALDKAREHVAAGRTVYEKLRFEAAQLDPSAAVASVEWPPSFSASTGFSGTSPTPAAMDTATTNWLPRGTRLFGLTTISCARPR
jgi:hypothetical protein